MTALLEVRDIARHYRVRRGDGWWRKPATLKAVDGISFRIERGKTLGLVGESGCGKSTAARLALGLLPATSGAALFEGAPLSAKQDAGWRATRARLQLVFQDTLGSLDRRLPVGRQIMEPLEIHGIGDAAERVERARELFAAVGLLPHLFERYPHELSGGQRQRVVLARALIAGPALIACDEPISALDVSIQAQVINLLQELRERFGVAYLFISHDLKVVRQISDEVAVMYLGRIVEQGSPERVFRQPAHPYAQALVSAIPGIRRTRQRMILPGDPPSPVDVPQGCAFHPRCPMAMARCRVETPALVTQPDGHRVACHLAGTAVSPSPRTRGEGARAPDDGGGVMGRYLAIRGLRALLTVIFVVTFAFVILRLSGDPALLILSPEAPPEAVEAFRKSWGLDRPLWEQYLRYFAAIFDGNLGRSMRDGRPAIELVMDRVPQTLAITLPAFALKLAIGVPAGIIAALYRNSIIDRVVIVCSVAGHSVPSFVLGLMLVLLFAVRLNWLPSGGADSWTHGILPVITLGTAGAAIIARFTRSAMLEVLGQPYVRAALAKGVPWRGVVWRHALPNAAIPTVTIIGFMVGTLIAGAVVVESVFSWPGVGRMLVVGVANRDLAVVQCILLLVAACMVTSNFTVDLLYGWIDPRLRARATGRAGS